MPPMHLGRLTIWDNVESMLSECYEYWVVDFEHMCIYTYMYKMIYSYIQILYVPQKFDIDTKYDGREMYLLSNPAMFAYLC